MKILIEESVLRQALEFVEYQSNKWNGTGVHPMSIVTALRAALDAAEKVIDGNDYFVCSAGSDEYGRFIAAASPRTVIRLLDDLKAAEHQRDELIAQKFSEEPLRRQIAELRELGRFREKHSLTGSPEVYDDPSAAFHKFACETHDALKAGAGETAIDRPPLQKLGADKTADGD